MPKPIVVNHSLFAGEHSLPKVVKAAEKLGVRKNEIRGCWIAWVRCKQKLKFDKVTPENVATQPVERQITPGMIDALVELPGFAQAMIEVGWLELTPVGFVVSSPDARMHYANEMSARAARQQAEQQRQMQAQQKKAAEPKSEKPVEAKPASNGKPKGTTLAAIRRERQTAGAK